MKKNIFILIIMAVAFVGCSDLMDPAIENIRQLEEMTNEAALAQGILANGYTRIPTNSYSFDDVATDDAVSNNSLNSYTRIAIGQWSAVNNPTEKWRNCFGGIQYMNIFLSSSDKVLWSADSIVNKHFNLKMKAEAYALRALFMYNLLKAHAGWVNGQLMGVPIIVEAQGPNSDFNLPRASFEDCMNMLYADLDSAEKVLPNSYVDISTASADTRFSGMSVSQYNRVYGTTFSGRVDGRIVKAIRAQAALMAASPAFSYGNTTSWDKAADYAAQILDLNNGITGISANGYTWYNNAAEIDNLLAGANPAEVLWRNTYSTSSSLESDNLPPTLYGNGRINPTQNLVDAFPMANGYPISDLSNSGYSAATPYTGRDPRLAAYIIVNGSTFGSSKAITLTTGNDAVNATEKSTRTGYYLRKLLRSSVSYNSAGGSWNTQRHYVPRIRFTELYLIYAEAANEAWGPDGMGTHNYSARQVIAAIRKRAGVGGASDPYLASIASKEEMRNLIHNERRLELCFEGHRFWDIRRWKEDITTPATGISFASDGLMQPKVTVETRSYDPEYMYYGPIPYEETLKWSKLEQNDGWKK